MVTLTSSGTHCHSYLTIHAHMCRAGNDAAVKKYLAKELEKARGQRDGLQRRLQEQENREREGQANYEGINAACEPRDM